MILKCPRKRWQSRLVDGAFGGRKDAVGDRAEDAVPDALVGDLREEALEVIELAFADDDIGLHIEPGEQRCGAMTLEACVIVAARPFSIFEKIGGNQVPKMNERGFKMRVSSEGARMGHVQTLCQISWLKRKSRVVDRPVPAGRQVQTRLATRSRFGFECFRQQTICGLLSPGGKL